MLGRREREPIIGRHELRPTRGDLTAHAIQNIDAIDRHRDQCVRRDAGPHKADLEAGRIAHERRQYAIDTLHIGVGHCLVDGGAAARVGVGSAVTPPATEYRERG